MKYLHQGITTESDIRWLCELTKFDDSTISAFIDYFVVGWPSGVAARKNNIDADNFNKRLVKLEALESHIQKRINRLDK